MKTEILSGKAQQKCRDLVTLFHRIMGIYKNTQKLARSVYERYTDQVEPMVWMSAGWILPEQAGLFGSPVEICKKIRETIKFELGLTISVGVHLIRYLQNSALI